MDTRTRFEAFLGKRQRYIHAGFDPFRGTGMNIHPEPFRPPFGKRRKATRGGRWNIRKLAQYQSDGLYWHAYANGKCATYNSRFATQQEALAWACAMLKRAEEATR